MALAPLARHLFFKLMAHRRCRLFANAHS